MARKKKNPTPSLLAGQPAPGSNRRTSGEVRPHLIEADDEARRPSGKAGTPGTAERKPQRSTPNPDARFRAGVGTPGTAERGGGTGSKADGARLTLRIDLDAEDVRHLVRLTPADETLESAARHYLLSILRDLDDALMNGPLQGEELADPRRGLRLVGGGPARSSPRTEPPLPPCA
jgi:hypothetical protein